MFHCILELQSQTKYLRQTLASCEILFLGVRVGTKLKFNVVLRFSIYFGSLTLFGDSWGNSCIPYLLQIIVSLVVKGKCGKTSKSIMIVIKVLL